MILARTKSRFDCDVGGVLVSRSDGAVSPNKGKKTGMSMIAAAAVAAMAVALTAGNFMLMVMMDGEQRMCC